MNEQTFSDNTNLLIRNGGAGAVALAAHFHFGKNWTTALTYAAVAYFVLDWAVNLRAA